MRNAIITYPQARREDREGTGLPMRARCEWNPDDGLTGAPSARVRPGPKCLCRLSRHVGKMTDKPSWVTLTDGEDVVWQGKPAIFPYVASLVGEVLLIVLGLGLWLTGGIGFLVGVSFDPGISVFSLSFWILVGLVLFAWGALGVGSTGLKWWSKHYVVTTDEIYKKSGLISRSVQSTRLADIQNTSFSQPMLGRLGSYGTVNIYTAGTAGREIGFEKVKNPNLVVSKITEQRSASGQ